MTSTHSPHTYTPIILLLLHTFSTDMARWQINPEVLCRMQQFVLFASVLSMIVFVRRTHTHMSIDVYDTCVCMYGIAYAGENRCSR